MPLAGDHVASGSVLRQKARIFAREHAALLALLACYFACAALYFAFLNRFDAWHIRGGNPVWLLAAVTFSAGRLLAARLRQHAASRLWRLESVAGAVLVLGTVAPFQSTFSSVKRTIDDVRGFPWDPVLASADRWLHGGRHPWEWLYPMAANRELIFWLDRLYLWWFPLISLFFFWVAWVPLKRLRQRALISTVLVWAICGNLLAFALASAGPCYYDLVVPDKPNPYERLLATLDLHARSGEYVQARTVQRMLWRVSPDSPLAPVGGVSAMPSVHVAFAVLLAVIAWQRHKAAGLLLSAYAVCIMVASVTLGWHYAIDGYVGGLLAVGCWRVSDWLAPAVEDVP